MSDEIIIGLLVLGGISLLVWLYTTRDKVPEDVKNKSATVAKVDPNDPLGLLSGKKGKQGQ